MGLTLRVFFLDSKIGCVTPNLDARPYKKKNIPFSIFGSVTPFMKKKLIY